MQANDRTQKNGPKQARPAERKINNHRKRNGRNPVILADPDVVFVFAKIGNKGKQFFCPRMHGFSGDDPTHMCKKSAVIWRVRIAFFVRVLMVHAMRCNPRNRPAFDRKRAASRQNVLHPFGGFESAVSQQTVVAHSDAKAACNPVNDDRENKSFPRKEKECRKGKNMKGDEESSDAPNNWTRKSLIVFEKAHNSPD